MATATVPVTAAGATMASVRAIIIMAAGDGDAITAGATMASARVTTITAAGAIATATAAGKH